MGSVSSFGAVGRERELPKEVAVDGTEQGELAAAAN